MHINTFIIYNTNILSRIHNVYIVYTYELCKFINLYTCICSIYSCIHIQNVILQNFNYISKYIYIWNPRHYGTCDQLFFTSRLCSRVKSSFWWLHLEFIHFIPVYRYNLSSEFGIMLAFLPKRYEFKLCINMRPGWYL